MGRTQLDGDTDARLRAIEAELDDELGLDDEVEAAATGLRRQRPVSFGKMLLGALGVVLAVALALKFVRFIVGIALLVALVAGLLWLIGVLRGGGDD